MQRRLRRARHGAALAGQHLPVEELAVDAAEADRALVPGQPHAMAELAQHVALGAAGHEQLRRVLHGRLVCAQAARMRVSSHSLLRERADHSAGMQSADLGAGQELAVAQVGRGREHVELEAEPQPLGQARRASAAGSARSDVNGSMRRRALSARARSRSRRTSRSGSPSAGTIRCAFCAVPLR